VPVFDYTALDKSGRRERGTVDADSLAEARRKLRAARVHVLSIEATDTERPAAGLAGRRIELRRIGVGDLASATRQWAMLLNSGMAVVPALGVLVEQTGSHPIGRVLGRVRDRVNEGMSLAKALEEHPRVFPEVYVNMVGAGEAGGELENVLVRLADMLERRVRLGNKVRAALAYPAFMSLVAAGVVIFLLTFVVPSIAKLFIEMKRTLPWPTVALITLSGFLRDYLWVIALALVGGWMAFRVWAATESGRLLRDRWVLKLPLFGPLFLKMAVSRFARTLGTLLGSGVTILEALDIVKRVVGNACLAQTIDEVKQSVRHGDSIANPLRRSGVFPPIVCHLVASGERGGNVEEGLLKVADIYDNDVETSVVALTSLLEPVLILVMGLVVGFIVLAILLPVFEINQAIK
jgi:general secretion pathway protein F